MSVREFTITELKSNGDGLVDTPVKFVWSNERMSAPRGSWRFGLTQRTVREDYPGVERPVEQVLGPNYKDFSLQGVWDDRYNSDGFALDQMRRFEALVQRGSLCRFEFETLALVGIPKDADFDYKRAAYIGYNFTVSPHYRQVGGSEGVGGRRKVPDALRPVTEFRDVSIEAAAFMEAVFAVAPAKTMKGSTHADNRGILNQVHQGVADLVSAVEWRVQAGEETLVDLKRVSNALSVIKGTAASMITSVASLKSSTAMAYENAVDSLDFDAWRTGLSAYARKLALTGVQGRDELARRVEPKAVALYRPRAGESLYGIAQRFYGTPTAWQQIATRNGLTTITLQGTELLIIPERR